MTKQFTLLMLLGALVASGCGSSNSGPQIDASAGRRPMPTDMIPAADEIEPQMAYPDRIEGSPLPPGAQVANEMIDDAGQTIEAAAGAFKAQAQAAKAQRNAVKASFEDAASGFKASLRQAADDFKAGAEESYDEE